MGNLILVSQDDNSNRLKSKPYIEKIKILQESGYKLPEDLPVDCEINEEIIRGRTKNIAEEAVESFWKIDKLNKTSDDINQYLGNHDFPIELIEIFQSLASKYNIDNFKRDDIRKNKYVFESSGLISVVAIINTNKKSINFKVGDSEFAISENDSSTKELFLKEVESIVEGKVDLLVGKDMFDGGKSLIPLNRNSLGKMIKGYSSITEPVILKLYEAISQNFSNSFFGVQSSTLDKSYREFTITDKTFIPGVESRIFYIKLQKKNIYVFCENIHLFINEEKNEFMDDLTDYDLEIFDESKGKSKVSLRTKNRVRFTLSTTSDVAEFQKILSDFYSN